MWRASFRIFSALSALQEWQERHFTRAGTLVLAGMILTGALGFDTRQTLAYQIFALLAALLVVAVAAAWWRTAQCAVRRELPRNVTAGEPATYRLRISNPSDRPLTGITLLEDIADPRPTFAEFRATLKFPVYRAWKRLLAQRRIVQVAETGAASIGPRTELELEAKAQALRRGVAHFTGLTVARSDPLGLFRRLTVVPRSANLIVLPRRYPLPAFRLPGSRRYQPGGVALASSVGDSEEFLGLRDYRPGDPPKRIHWKSFARAMRPVVKETQDEFFERHALVLDTFVPAGAEPCFEEAVSLAASFATAINTNECLLDLIFVGDRSYCYTAGRGQMQPTHLLEVLAGLRACTEGSFRRLHQGVLAQHTILTGCICLLLAWDEARREFLRELRACGVPLRALVVTERELPNRPQWLLALQPGRIREGLTAL